MRELEVNVQQVEGIEVINLSGAVDAASFANLAAVLSRMVEEDAPCVVLECKKVSYIGSANLKELIDFARYARARGGDIKCIGLSPTIQQIANLIAMGDLMECHDDLAGAMRSFGDVAAAVAR